MYGFNATLELSFDAALERVMAALKQEGFGVPARVKLVVA